jgi:hypothetical protein
MAAVTSRSEGRARLGGKVILGLILQLGAAVIDIPGRACRGLRRAQRRVQVALQHRHGGIRSVQAVLQLRYNGISTAPGPLRQS